MSKTKRPDETCMHSSQHTLNWVVLFVIVIFSRGLSKDNREGKLLIVLKNKKQRHYFTYPTGVCLVLLSLNNNE